MEYPKTINQWNEIFLQFNKILTAKNDEAIVIRENIKSWLDTFSNASFADNLFNFIMEQKISSDPIHSDIFNEIFSHPSFSPNKFIKNKNIENILPVYLLDSTINLLVKDSGSIRCANYNKALMSYLKYGDTPHNISNKDEIFIVYFFSVMKRNKISRDLFEEFITAYYTKNLSHYEQRTASGHKASQYLGTSYNDYLGSIIKKIKAKKNEIEKLESTEDSNENSVEDKKNKSFIESILSFIRSFKKENTTIVQSVVEKTYEEVIGHNYIVARQQCEKIKPYPSIYQLCTAVTQQYINIFLLVGDNKQYEPYLRKEFPVIFNNCIDNFIKIKQLNSQEDSLSESMILENIRLIEKKHESIFQLFAQNKQDDILKQMRVENKVLKMSN